MSRLLAGWQRPTRTAWTRDDADVHLPRIVLGLWQTGLDTADITSALRRRGWLVTQAGIANALAKRPRSIVVRGRHGVSLPSLRMLEQEEAS